MPVASSEQLSPTAALRAKTRGSNARRRTEDGFGLSRCAHLIAFPSELLRGCLRVLLLPDSLRDPSLN